MKLKPKKKMIISFVVGLVFLSIFLNFYFRLYESRVGANFICIGIPLGREQNQCLGYPYIYLHVDPYLPSTTPISLPTLTPSVTKLSTKNNDSKWKTYSDSVAKFSIQYESTDSIRDKKEGEYVYFGSSVVVIYSDYNGGSRREWFNKKFNPVGYKVTYEDYNVAGVNALIIKLDDPGSMGSVNVVIPKGNKIYLFSKSSGQETLTETKRIISTFKFI